MKFDLHIHTNHSDGIFTPEEVVDLAVKKGLTGISITDHDSISAISAGMKHGKKYPDFKIIPGIEFSCIHKDEEVHILGYFLDYSNRELIEASNKLRNSRKDRAYATLKLLNQLGIDISINDLLEFTTMDYIGRPHIAKTMIKKGFISSVQEGFEKYLRRGQAAYVERYHMNIKDTLKLISRTGGISILAHPGLLKDKSIINDTIDYGIEGIECIHSKHNPTETKEFIKMAKSKGLLITGGSDCHGALIDGELLMGKYYIGLDKILQMKERIK